MIGFGSWPDGNLVKISTPSPSAIGCWPLGADAAKVKPCSLPASASPANHFDLLTGWSRNLLSFRLQLPSTITTITHAARPWARLTSTPETHSIVLFLRLLFLLVRNSGIAKSPVGLVPDVSHVTSPFVTVRFATSLSAILYRLSHAIVAVVAK